jgi:hypothetical protein
MQPERPEDGNGRSLSPSEGTAGLSGHANHPSQLDLALFHSAAPSDRHGEERRATAARSRAIDSLDSAKEATSSAAEGGIRTGRDVPEPSSSTATAQRQRLRDSADAEAHQVSTDPADSDGVNADAKQTTSPVVSVFAIPRDKLFARWTAANGPDTGASSSEAEKGAALDENRETHRRDERRLDASPQEGPDGGGGGARASDFVSPTDPATDSDWECAAEDEQAVQTARHWQWQPALLKRARSAEAGATTHSSTDAAGRGVHPGRKAVAGFADLPRSHDEGDEDLEPASQRRRTDEHAPGDVGSEAPTTVKPVHGASEEWRQDREANLYSLPAQEVVRIVGGQDPARTRLSIGASLPPSYEFNSSIVPPGAAYPYGDANTPLLRLQTTTTTGGGTSTFSGRAGTTAMTPSQWQGKGSAYYVADEQQRAQSSMQGYPPPPAAAADSTSQNGSAAARQAHPIYDSPESLLQRTSSSSYHYGGVPGYVYDWTQQQQQQEQRYPSPSPGLPFSQPRGYDASSPSTRVTASSSALSNLRGSKGEWSDPASSAATTVSTSVSNTPSSSPLLSRSTKAAETRNAVPIRTQSNLASITRNAPAPGSSLYSQGKRAAKLYSSVVVPVERGRIDAQDATSRVTSGSGGGGTTSTTSGSKVRKPSGRKPTPANAYSINQVRRLCRVTLISRLATSLNIRSLLFPLMLHRFKESCPSSTSFVGSSRILKRSETSLPGRAFCPKSSPCTRSHYNLRGEETLKPLEYTAQEGRLGSIGQDRLRERRHAQTDVDAHVFARESASFDSYVVVFLFTRLCVEELVYGTGAYVWDLSTRRTGQFAVYGFSPIKDPEELAEVLDPATQPADAWRAYVDESGTFHRDSLNDIEALKKMVAKKKGGGSTTTTTTTAGGRQSLAAQQQPQPSAAVIPVQAQGIDRRTTVLPSFPGNVIAATTPGAGGTSFPTLQQGYWPSATTTQSGHPHASSSSSSSSGYPHYHHYHQQQQRHQQQASPSASASASEFGHIVPKPAGQAQGQGQVLDGGEGGGGSSKSRSQTEIWPGGWFR